LDQVNLAASSAPFKDAEGKDIEGVEKAKVGTGDKIVGVTKTPNGLAVVVGNGKDNPNKLFVVKGKQVIFGIDNKYHSRNKNEMKNVDESMKSLIAKNFYIANVELVKDKEGKDFVKFQARDVQGGFGQKNPFFVVSLDDGNLSVATDEASYTKVEVADDGKYEAMYAPIAEGAKEVDPEAQMATVDEVLKAKKVNADAVNAALKAGKFFGAYGDDNNAYIVVSPLSVFELKK
jgi:hypothetical protein